MTETKTKTKSSDAPEALPSKASAVKGKGKGKGSNGDGLINDNDAKPTFKGGKGWNNNGKGNSKGYPKGGKGNYADYAGMTQKNELTEKLNALDAEVEEFKQKLKGISREIEIKTEGKDEHNRKRDEIRARLDAVQARLSDLESKKESFHVTLKEKAQEGREKRSAVKDMEKKLGFESEEEINRRIAEIEYSMHTETLNLKREKELIQQIQKLKSIKPQVAKVKDMKISLLEGTDQDALFAPVKADIQSISIAITEAREERKLYQAELNKLVEARKLATDGVVGLFEERNQLRDQMSKKLDELKLVKAERAEKLKEHMEKIEKERAERDARYEGEKKLRDAEYEKKRLDEELEREGQLPFFDKIELCQNAIVYCKSLKPKGNVVEVKTLTGLDSIEQVAGTKVLPSRKDREQSFFFKGGKSVKTAKVASDNSNSPLKLTIEVLQIFSQLGVDAPFNSKDVERCEDALHAVLLGLKKKQEEEIENRKLKRVAKEQEVAAKLEDAKKIVASVKPKREGSSSPRKAADASSPKVKSAKAQELPAIAHSPSAKQGVKSPKAKKA